MNVGDGPRQRKARLASSACIGACILAVGCTALNPGSSRHVGPEALTDAEIDAALSGSEDDRLRLWRHVRLLPNKPITVYTEQRSRIEGWTKPYRVIQAHAKQSASSLWLRLNVQLYEHAELSWTWRKELLPQAIEASANQQDDAAARLMLAFDGDKSKLAPREQALLDLARTLSGEEPPYATLIYSTSKVHAVDTVLRNPRTSRVRTIVVGAEDTGSWKQYQRNPYADFQKAFGELPGRLIGVGLMTDSDNTQSEARASYGPIRLRP